MIDQPLALSDFQKRLSWRDVDPTKILPLLKISISEDIDKRGDITSSISGVKGSGLAAIVAREEMVICGIHLIPLIINQFEGSSVKVDNIKFDGQKISSGTEIAYLEGKQKDILTIERTILNFIQRLSGISTLTNQFSSILSKYQVGLLDTRKTTPGHRILEKYATGCGGGYNHRMSLSDRILIKDNHLAANQIDSEKKLFSFLKKVKQISKNLILEVEIDEIKYLETSIEAGADAVLLDNFTPEEVKSAVSINENRIVLEASGGITLNSIEKFAIAKPHFISSGAPVHSSRWIDIGLDWK